MLSEQRRNLLENYQQLVGKQGMQIEPLIRAFMDPFFELVFGKDDRGRNYARLLARFVWRENASEILAEGFNEVAKLYLENFREALSGPTHLRAGCRRRSCRSGISIHAGGHLQFGYR